MRPGGARLEDGTAALDAAVVAAPDDRSVVDRKGEELDREKSVHKIMTLYEQKKGGKKQNTGPMGFRFRVNQNT